MPLVSVWSYLYKIIYNQRPFIGSYSLENETVLDFTMGSGSTGVACLNNNRKFIGIEKDDYYFEISKKRIVRFKLRLEKSKKDE